MRSAAPIGIVLLELVFGWHAASAAEPAKARESVELVGTASEFWYSRNWQSYYWREDFSLALREDGTGTVWQVISREPTPAYQWRMGTTFTGLKVDWQKNPRVKIVGVTGVDRIPVTFYDRKLDVPNLVTALLVFVEAAPGKWQEWYVNNWFHPWGEKADRNVHAWYADKPAPYDIYGFARGQVAPFDAKSQAVLLKHRDNPSLMFRGRLRTAKENPFGFELELLDLIGRDVKTGGPLILHGDANSIPLLDSQPPASGKEKEQGKEEEQEPKDGAAKADPPRRFVDVSTGSGLTITAPTGVGGTNPHAVAVEDFNGDGLADVIIPTFGKPFVYYFRNLGGLRFREVTRGSGLENYEGDGTGAAIADFDRDGRPDVYLTSLRKGANRLYRGRGDGTFEDASDRTGLLVTTPARSCAWCDIDRDGWPDLYVTCPSGPNLLFRNRGNGTFANIAREAGVELADRMSLGCVFGDVDGDGLEDLFVANYQSQISTLFRNLGGGKFRDVTAEAGVERRASAVGCVLADLFRRGRPDLLLTTDSWLSGANYTEEQMRKMGHTVEPNVLYENRGTGSFAPMAEPSLALKTLAHDAVLEDLDHDGWPEIYVGVDAESGNQWATSKGGNPLWTRTGGSAWREMSGAWGVRHEANCVCVPAVDFDNDGDLDLLLVNFYSQPVLYRNETNDRQWLRIRAAGTKSSRDGLGAKVSVFARHEGREQLIASRHIHSGAGYCRCSPLEAHLGLGAATGLRVEVRFPSGKTVTREQVPPGQALVISED